MKLSTYCNELISESQKYKPTYANGHLAIHLPMSLIALDKMGASKEQLSRFYSHSITKLDKRENTNALKISSLSQELGNKESFEEYVLYFKNQLLNKSISIVIEEALVILVKGISASAFHPAIRLSYAIEINNTDEIIFSLASWASEYLFFDNKFHSSSIGLEQMLAERNTISVELNFSPGNIVDRMQEITNSLNDKQINFQENSLTLNEIREFCIKKFHIRNNFTLLHTVTICKALDIINEYIIDKKSFLNYVNEAILIAMLSTGINFSLAKEKLEIKFSSWEEVKQKALNSNNDHVVKLVYTCWLEYEKFKNYKYQEVAERAVLKL